jgi:hypothetical protein
MVISRRNPTTEDSQMFDLHPVFRHAKNDLTKAFVNSAALSAIDTIAVSSMIAYVAVVLVGDPHPTNGFSFTSVRDTSWLS